jgi:hypothetical protein
MGGFDDRGKKTGSGDAGGGDGGASKGVGPGKQTLTGALPPMPAQVKVTASALNVRSAPAQEKHNVIGGLHHGQVIEAKTHDDPWLKIAFHGRDAFVHSGFVQPVEAPAHAAPTAHHDAPMTPAAHAEAHPAASAEIAVKPAHDSVPAKDKPKPALSSGYSKSGGGTTRAVLTRLASTGKLKITPSQIAQLDAASQIESGGKIASVDTTDDQVVSIGFFQLVLGHKSIEAIMHKVPAAFAKYGLELDMSKTYDFASHPHQIKGVEDYRELRGHEWGDKFYAASNDDAVIVAMAEFALAEAANVQAITTTHGGTGDYFADDTARAWLLELHNNRPAYVAVAVDRAGAARARGGKDREHFLDILAAAIEDAYEPEGVAMYHHAKSEKKNQSLTPEQDAVLLAQMKAKARLKGTHIVQRISRHLELPTLGPAAANAPHAAEAHAAPTAGPAPAPAPAAHPAGTTAPAPAAAVDPLDTQYQLILAEIDVGLLLPSEGIDLLAASDRSLHGGKPSPKGLQLIAQLPAAVAARTGGAAAKADPHAPTDHKPERPQSASTAHGPTKPEPTPAKAEPAKAKPAPAAVAWMPPADANLTDEALLRMAAELHDANADKALHDLGGVVAIGAKLKRNLYNAAEPQGPDRENLVAGIAVVRNDLQAIRGTDPRTAAFKVAVNHKLEALSPYYAQINIMTIESKGGLSTCNVTSLAMSLSTVGKNADAYKDSKRPQLVAVAHHYGHDVAGAARASAGHDVSFASLRGLRLPDFMELAAIATNLHSANPSEAEIKKAAQFAVDNKTDLSFLAQIAQDFNAQTTLSYNTIGAKKTAALKKIGNAYHIKADDLVDLRNRAEAHPDDKALRARYERAKAEADPQINSAELEKELGLDDYRSSVMGVIKPLLDSGAGVISGTYNHFTHCYEMTDDHIRVQDPGLWARADRKVRWDEARALEYFWNYLVVR